MFRDAKLMLEKGNKEDTTGCIIKGIYNIIIIINTA